MKKMLRQVTVTGADDCVEPKELVRLYEEYPYAEFGILVSRNNTPRGRPRFPCRDWIAALARYLRENQRVPTSPDLPISVHVCGEWVRDVFRGWDLVDWLENIVDTEIVGHVSRWQLNTHREPHPIFPEGLVEHVEGLSHDGRQVIFQLDQANDHAVTICDLKKLDVAVLHDLSCGAGILPDQWMPPVRGLPNGYAGGLSPDNVASEVEKISRLLDPGQLVWVDAETKLRTPDDRLSMSLVERFLEACRPYAADLEEPA
jgi:hypothetical protein